MRRSVFVFAVLLLVAAALYAATSMWMALARLDRLGGAGEAMLRAEESRTLAQGLLASAVDIETATRGFVLSGDPAQLMPLNDARTRAPQQLDALRDHVRSDPEQLSRLNRVTRELAESLTLSELIVERRRVASGATLEIEDLGDRAMTATKSIRGLVDEIDASQRQRLGSARTGWTAELRDARTVEIAMGALTLAVVGLATWVLARLRRLGRRADAAAAETESREAAIRGVGMHLEGALDATDRVQAASGADAAASARFDPLRSGIEGALDEYTRVTDDAVPEAIHRGALDVALHELARRAGLRCGTVVREAIDPRAQPLDPSQARLLYRAAEWAERLLKRRPRDGELLVALTTTDQRAEVRVEGPCAWDGAPNELSAAERHAYERLAAEVAAAGGSCYWTAEAGTGRLHASVLRVAGPGPRAAGAGA